MSLPILAHFYRHQNYLGIPITWYFCFGFNISWGHYNIPLSLPYLELQSLHMHFSLLKQFLHSYMTPSLWKTYLERWTHSKAFPGNGGNVFYWKINIPGRRYKRPPLFFSMASYNPFHSEFRPRLVEQKDTQLSLWRQNEEGKDSLDTVYFSKSEWISSWSNCAALKLVALPNSLPSDSPLKPSVWEYIGFSVCLPSYPFKLDALWPEK